MQFKDEPNTGTDFFGVLGGAFVAGELSKMLDLKVSLTFFLGLAVTAVPNSRSFVFCSSFGAQRR